MPSSIAIAGPVETACAQVALRTDDVGPTSAVPHGAALTRAGVCVCAFGAANLIGREVPSRRRSPSDVSTPGAVRKDREWEVPPRRRTAAAGGLDGQ